MLDLKSTAIYQIKDRGTVYEVRSPFACKDRRIFLGDVKIDGVVRKVTGVESNALGTIPEGSPVGLLADSLIWQYFCNACGCKRGGLLDHPVGIGGYSWACPECKSNDIGCVLAESEK